MGYCLYVTGKKKYQHETLALAYAEANNLAMQTGRPVQIMEYIGSVQPTGKPTVPQTKPRAEAGRVGEKV